MSKKKTDNITDADLQQEIRAHQQTKERLKESEERYRHLTENASDIIYGVDRTGHSTFFNPVAVKIMGYTEEELKGKHYLDVIRPDYKDSTGRFYGVQFVKKIPTTYREFPVITGDGKEIWLGQNVQLVMEGSRVKGFQAVARDITKRKRAEEKIKASLREKEVLLKEIHHRVKNNLQTISSLLNLQSAYITDEQALRVFKSSQERIRAMALIHETLYQSEDISKINFAEYIQNLVTHLLDSHQLNPGQVREKMQIHDANLGIETAIPVGLLINELVSNSLKHAFPGDRTGELHVNLGKSEDKEYDYILIVRDNGVGFPEHLDFRSSDTLGMLLTRTLVKQLRGAIDLDRKDGTTFTIKFKKLLPKSKPKRV